MQVKFMNRYLRRLDGFRDEALHAKLRMIVSEVLAAKSIANISGLKKLKGHHTAYRIRIGAYRLGLYIEKDFVTFASVGYRMDIYKHFPN